MGSQFLVQFTVFKISVVFKDMSCRHAELKE